MAWKYAPGWVLVAVLVLAGCAAAPSAPRSAAAPSPHAAWHPAGPLPKGNAGLRAAPYFIQVFDGRAQVIDSATGQVTATIRRSRVGYLTGAAAAGDDRTFVLAAESSATSQLLTRYYELRLDDGGIPGPLWPLAVPPMSGRQLPFAVSPDGSELAISDPGGIPSARGQIVVVSLATGTARSWRAPVPGGAESLSWAGNSRLAFDWGNPWRRNPVTDPHAGVRLLDTSAAGSNLLAGSRLVISASARFGSYTGIHNPLITADGSKLFAAMEAGSSSPKVVVVEFSARTGHPQRAVTAPATESGHGAWCGAVWTDPSGQHALATCYFLFKVDHGRFTRVWLRSPGASAGGSSFAW
jgi:hypothetical protein